MKKKILSLGIIVFLLFGSLFNLTGCGSTTDNNPDNNSNKSSNKSKVSIIENMRNEAQEPFDGMFEYNSDGWYIHGGPVLADDYYMQDETKATKGVYKFVENNNTYYYFRGDVDNNWVYFAGFYWRIIRTNEDNSIRMIYAGSSTTANGADIAIGKSKFASNSSVNSVDYNNSFVKTYVENWYSEHLEDYDKYIANEIYVNDTSYNNDEDEYEAAIRVRNDGIKYDSTNPSLKENTSGNYTAKIGLPTADEVVMIGLTSIEKSCETYLSPIEGSQTNFWTMTPCMVVAGAPYMFIVSYHLYSHPVNLNELAIRPVISLTSDVISNVSGDGTANNPYIID
jgi:hypothetical protein